MPYRSTLLLALALVAVPSLARAELPDPAAFPVRFSVLDPSGQPVREMTDDDLNGYVNLARCECGQSIRAALSMAPPGAPDPAEQINAYVGPACDVAEADPDGQFRPCGGLTSQAAATYADGIDVDVHPLFLGRGVADIATRFVGDSATVVSGGCGGLSGEAGVWLCAPLENGQSGCQPDEFFRDPQPPIRLDFTPPLSTPDEFTVEPGDRSVRLRWSVTQVGDIHGYRILCADEAGAPIPGLAVDPPEPTAPADGTHYFNAHNLCGDQPFTSVMITDPAGPAGTCGDGVLDEDEECDDPLRGDDHLCAADCTLRVPAELYALDWDYVCSDHIAFDEDEVLLGGLENGKTYRFVLVTHDRHGNPSAFSKLAVATPEPELPAFAPSADDGCDCDAGREGHVPGALLAFVLLALVRRRAAG